MEIVELGKSARDAAIATLSAAFSNDPAICWLFPDPRTRARRLPLLMGWTFDDHLTNGLVLGTTDAGAVTLWRPPGTVHRHDALTPPVILKFLRIFGTAIVRAERIDRAIGMHILPGEELFYLRMAAVRPEQQGKGLGGKTIRAGLAHSARAGKRPVLETATASNVGLYQRLGYEVVEEWDVSRAGPHFWTMAHPR
ncbi:GNAT family N-acetyltransferase [Novosphingobium sp. ZN18A2]|uniref:GNAT family N-acetyltransferase n=1 Tax=Novosphingobium sp. ZN18A2 TaxID=3079861 RepID=UPI0030D4B8A2